MASFMKPWTSCGRSGCGRLIECWKMRPCWPLSMRRCRSGIRAAAHMAAPVPRRRWCCAGYCSSISATGVLRSWNFGAEKVPDAKTLGRVARALAPQVIEKIHSRMVALAQEQKVVSGRRMRVDTTVVEANIHYPTDSSLLGDGVRVLTRLMTKVTEIAGKVGTKLRDRRRSVQRRLMEIGRASRSKGKPAQEKVKTGYGKLLEVTQRVTGQAKKFSTEISQGIKRASELLPQAALQALQRELDTMVVRVGQVIRQTQARVFDGNTHAEGKLVSLFEPDTEIIRKGKASKPTEFGKLVKIQEAENQIIIAYEVYAQ